MLQYSTLSLARKFRQLQGSYSDMPAAGKQGWRWITMILNIDGGLWGQYDDRNCKDCNEEVHFSVFTFVPTVGLLQYRKLQRDLRKAWRRLTFVSGACDGSCSPVFSSSPCTSDSVSTSLDTPYLRALWQRKEAKRAGFIQCKTFIANRSPPAALKITTQLEVDRHFNSEINWVSKSHC